MVFVPRRKRKSLGLTLDRDRGICRLTNADREEWINNDEGLYNWQRRSRQSMRAFIKANKAEIDAAVCRVLLGGVPQGGRFYQTPSGGKGMYGARRR